METPRQPGGGEWRELLQENQRYLKAIYRQVEKTRRYILWGRVISVIYLILILAPIIIALVYLPPLVRNTFAPYQELLGGSSSKQDVNQGLLEQAQQLLNSAKSQ
jgi:hypothetical protein